MRSTPRTISRRGQHLMRMDCHRVRISDKPLTRPTLPPVIAKLRCSPLMWLNTAMWPILCAPPWCSWKRSITEPTAAGAGNTHAAQAVIRTPRARSIYGAESQEDRGEGFVLQILRIVRKAVPPILGTKGPQLCVAEDQEKYTANEKTGRPSEAGPGPILAQPAFPDQEKTSKHHEEPSQMMIKLAFLFILEGGPLFGATRPMVGHTHVHIHAFVFAIGWRCRVHLRCGLCSAQCE